MDYLEELRAKREAALARESQAVAENAYWIAKAEEVRAAQKAEHSHEVVLARTSCRSAVTTANGAPLPSSLVWMPKGDHEINAGTLAGGSWSGLVRCDELGAQAVANSFAQILAAGWRVWIDRDHDDGAATADVHGFSWDPALGIIAKVEWTPLGERCLREGEYRSFSPAFFCNTETGRVTALIPGHAAGGLVNAPAFGAAMPRILASSRGEAASLVRGSLLHQGIAEDVADRAAEAVAAGYDGEAVSLYIRALLSRPDSTGTRR